MRKPNLKIISLLFLLFSSAQLWSFGIFETRYIEENFQVFGEENSKSSKFHVPNVSIENLLDDYILSIMNKYVDSADDYVRKKNGEQPLRPRKVLANSTFSNRVKPAPYLVMKYDIEKNGSKWPSRWTYTFNEAKAAEQKVYLEEKAKNITDYILAARTCFAIDPAILTALIHKESFFSPVAVSFTGAAGLTQFTGVAFGEIAMQTGDIPNEADQDAIRYNLAQLECMERETGEEIPSIDEIMNMDENFEGEIYYRSQTTGRLAIRGSTIKTLKNYFKDHMLSSIAYGSILLKTYLAYECRLAPGKNCTPDSKGNLVWNKEYVYKQALERYNGDTNPKTRSGVTKPTKVYYAQDIWNEAVNKISPKLRNQKETALKQEEMANQKPIKLEVAPLPMKKGFDKHKKVEKKKADEEKPEKRNVFIDFWNYITSDND